jgi:hypothetical protein
LESDPAEGAARAALLQAGFDARGLHLLPGGRRNRVFRAGRVAAKVFLPGSANPLFPNDPALEWRALAHLRGTGLAPEPLARDHVNGLEVILSRFVDGNEPAPPLAAAALGRLHGLDGSGFPLRLVSVAELTALASQLLRRSGATGLSLPGPPDPGPCAPAFIHGDATPANFLAGGIWADWQCPARGDAAFDLALYLSPGMRLAYGRGLLTADEQAGFLAAYPDAAVAARYRALKPLFGFLLAAYCLWRAAEGEADYGPAAKAELRALSA